MDDIMVVMLKNLVKLRGQPPATRREREETSFADIVGKTSEVRTSVAG